MQGKLADYDDMGIQVTKAVHSGKAPSRRCTYVLVDEYHDVSRMLVKILRALRDRMGFRLFCVGDD